jgi:hypothetical protein
VRAPVEAGVHGLGEAEAALGEQARDDRPGRVEDGVRWRVGVRHARIDTPSPGV